MKKRTKGKKDDVRIRTCKQVETDCSAWSASKNGIIKK